MPRVDEEQRGAIHPRSHCVPCRPWQGGAWQGGAWQGEWPSGCKEVLPPWPTADWRPQKLFCSSKWKSQPSSQVWKSNFCATEIHYYFRWRKKSSCVPMSISFCWRHLEFQNKNAMYLGGGVGSAHFCWELVSHSHSQPPINFFCWTWSPLMEVHPIGWWVMMQKSYKMHHDQNHVLVQIMGSYLILS